MLGLIKRILHDLTSAVSTIDHWVLGLIRAVYDYVNSLFIQLRMAVNAVHTALVAFERAIGAFANRVYTFAEWISLHLIPEIVQWARGELRKLGVAIDGALHWVEKWIARILNDIASAVRSITSWIIAHIWNPLFHGISIAWHWITHEGYFVYHLLTHPDLAAKWLARYLWASWLGLLRRYSRDITRWLLASMPHMAGDIVTLLEDFIANLL